MRLYGTNNKLTNAVIYAFRLSFCGNQATFGVSSCPSTQTEKEAVSAEVKEDGAFAYEITDAEDFVEHTVEITAREEGKQDCTAKFSFSTEYADASKGIKAYGKTLTEGLSGKELSQDPAGHVGERVKLVEGSYKNIKITTPEDIGIAEGFLRDEKRV